MKAFFTLLSVTFILLSTNSCKNCSTCRKYPAKDEQLCKKDYASDDSYAQAFRYWEGQGYDCE